MSQQRNGGSDVALSLPKVVTLSTTCAAGQWRQRRRGSNLAFVFNDMRGDIAKDGAARHQLIVAAGIHDGAVLHDDDTVAMPDGVQAMSDDDESHGARQILHRLGKVLLGA